MIVDARVHIGKAEPQMAGAPPLEPDGYPIEKILNLMKKAGVDKSVIIPAHRSDYREANKQVAELARAYPDKFIGFGRVNPNCTECAFDTAQEAVEKLGLKGLEVSYFAWKWYDPVIAVPFFRRLFELDVPIMIRADVDVGLVKFSLDQIADLSPLSPIIICVSWSFGQTLPPPHRDELFEIVRNNNNLFVETPGSETILLEKIVSRIGVHRVIFGSSSPPKKPISERAKIEAMRISNQEKELILGGNIMRILKGEL